jgi:hypothetical protein
VSNSAKKSTLKADEVPSVGVFPLLHQGLLAAGGEDFARWASPDTGRVTQIHVASKGTWLLVEGHPVGLSYTVAFGKPCRPQFDCPSCGRRCGRLYKLPEAFFPWRCARCAGLEYRAKHLKPFDRAERTYGRLAVLGRERRPRERRKQFYNRMVRLQAAERKLNEMAATLLESPRIRNRKGAGSVSYSRD